MENLLVSWKEPHRVHAVTKTESPQLLPTLRIDQAKGLLLAADIRLDGQPAPVEGKTKKRPRWWFEIVRETLLPCAHIPNFPPSPSVADRQRFPVDRPSRAHYHSQVISLGVQLLPGTEIPPPER